MITEDYISIEAANLLREKGFNEPTGFVYSENGELLKLSSFGVRYLSNSECDDYPNWQFPIEGVASIVSAPTLQMVMKWLRKVHRIDIEVRIHYLSRLKPNDIRYYSGKILKGSEDVIYTIYAKDTYEEVCEVAIKYCLENLI